MIHTVFLTHQNVGRGAGQTPARPLTLLADAQAALQLLQRDGPVLVPVTVVGELAGAPLRLGLLLQVPLERFEFLLVDVLTAVVVQLVKVPLHHPLLQGVAGVGLNKPGQGQERK